MNILPATGPDPVGAAALLAYAAPAELERFSTLEDAVWGHTTLPPAVIEAVRLRCAHLRSCASCSAVRITAATEDGLSEAKIALLDRPEDRTDLSATQRGALTLVDRYFRDPRAPESAEATRIAEVLGSRGVVEVLIACAVFSSSELRIALGEDRTPDGNIIVQRPRGTVAERSSGTHWPTLGAPVLDPEATLPQASPELTEPVRGLVRDLMWSGEDIPREAVAACVVRSTQLLQIEPGDPVATLLVPPIAVELADADDVRNWPHWPAGLARDVLGLAEQLWLDPSRVDEAVTDPLKGAIGVDGVIRATWALIWISQLHRLALVLHRGG